MRETLKGLVCRDSLSFLKAQKRGNRKGLDVTNWRAPNFWAETKRARDFDHFGDFADHREQQMQNGGGLFVEHGSLSRRRRIQKYRLRSVEPKKARGAHVHDQKPKACVQRASIRKSYCSV